MHERELLVLEDHSQQTQGRAHFKTTEARRLGGYKVLGICIERRTHCCQQATSVPQVIRLNTCENCGHYSWVHKNGKCGLEYCNCGKDSNLSAGEHGLGEAAATDKSQQRSQQNEKKKKEGKRSRKKGEAN